MRYCATSHAGGTYTILHFEGYTRTHLENMKIGGRKIVGAWKIKAKN